MDKKKEEENGQRVNLITEELFREAYYYEEERKPSFRKRVAAKLKCTKEKWLNIFPIARWLPKYNAKKELLNDVISGVTVAVMHIPHGLAYAPLGKVEPVTGFYMAIFPVFIYMILGTSRHISIGTFAVVCAMAGQIVDKHEHKPLNPSCPNVTARVVNTTAQESARSDSCSHWDYEAIQVGAAVCLLVGLWQMVLGILRLGSLTVIMSESLISGFTTGAACHVITYQLKHLFGVDIDPFYGILKILYIYIDFFRKIKTVNLVTMAFSFSCIAVLLIFNIFIKKAIDKRFPKCSIPIPIELIIVIIGILTSYFLKLSEKYNVKIVGYIPQGLPEPKVPPYQILPSLIIDSFIVAVVAIATNVSLAKIFAKKSDYHVSSNQELIAYGAANIFASFFKCIPSAASLSRSTIQHSVGGKTQLASLFSVTLLVLITLVAGSLFEPVPYCVLSSIVVVTLKGLIMQVQDLPRIWRQSYWDGIVWLGTFLSVLILGLDYGLGVGVLLSMISVLFSTYLIELNVMGRVSNTNIYLDIDHFKSAKKLPNILILQVIGNLNFTNSYNLEFRVTAICKKFLDSVQTEQCYIVLNMASVSQIDPTAINTLKQMHKYFKKFKCDLYLTDCNLTVYSKFETCKFFKDFPKDQVLASVSDAVDYLNSLS